MNDNSALPVYAIIRLDTQLGDLQAREGSSNAPEASSTVTIKKIVASVETARQEVERLNDLNRSESCRYYWQHVCLYPDDFEQIALRAERNEA